MYSALDPTVKEYTPQFSEETEKRWAEDKSTDSLLTLARIPLLGSAYLGDGKDHYALTYVSEANSMGTRMGFFGTEHAVAMPKVREVNSELQSATSYAAWGTFNWLVPAFHTLNTLPPESIRQTLRSTYMGDTFLVLCRFWRIIHQVILRYYRDQPYPREGLSDHITLAFAEYKYRELIAWAETLPPSMVRSEQSRHHVLIFHIWFHVAILSILHPLTVRARGSLRSVRFKTFPLVYRKNYMSSTYTMLWHTGLIHVANANLGDTKDPAWRFYLFFCIQCYGRLRQAYRFAEAIGRSLLSMALQQGDLPASEARHIMEQYEESRLINPPYDIRATFMADLNLAMTNPSEASVESLADRFEDIAIFQEFTNAVGSGEDELIESDDNSWDTL
ncbi:nitrogen assimilation transcription factor nit-4 [Fusarium flagelliforme]|uniref:Nitrogen assimilation transcription factor nit-4 n=1 Tax=Fusarium flagelliforme TaxID=2675880 RepID=A0A395MR57_9HYPO|nr:nitrogen assimilation transcription factor nit-4 [Fusarium flagelliforme]